MVYDPYWSLVADGDILALLAGVSGPDHFRELTAKQGLQQNIWEWKAKNLRACHHWYTSGSSLSIFY